MANLLVWNNCGRSLRRLMQQRDSCLALPGVYNGLLSRQVSKKGFRAGYVSGGALSAASGVPDIGLCSLDAFAKAIKQIVTASIGATAGGKSLPYICDADTGFGSLEMVRKTVYEYVSAGAAGLHLEDQEFPKRCGHLDGKSLVSVEDFCEVIKCAAKASTDFSGNKNFIICARSDARHVSGFDNLLDRCLQYAKCGADMIFPEGLHNIEEFRNLAVEMRKLGYIGNASGGGPFLLANMTEFGKTEHIHIDEFRNAGYHCVIYPVTTLRCAMKSTDDALNHLLDQGGFSQYLTKMQTRDELYELLDYDPKTTYQFLAATNID